jgi:geranylgeranyl diphosphate synthase, type I
VSERSERATLRTSERQRAGWRWSVGAQPPRLGGVSDHIETRPRAAAATDVLARARRLVEPALRDSLAGLHPDIRRAAEYHLGFVEADGTPGAGTGKGIRPTLAVLSAEAVGASPEVGVPGAVAIELAHNFSLLHDDIIDGDRERRHRPTVWALFGVGQAIIVGDALQTLAHEVLLSARTEASIVAAARLTEAVAEMIAGQADDMALESEEAISIDGSVRMAAAKTGALLACAASLGAVLAGADDRTVAALDRFGADLGLSFQAVDDILGIWGDTAVTGKPVGSDLASKKKTLPVAFAMAAEPDAAAELQTLFRNGSLDQTAVRRATAVIERVGARDATEACAREHLAAALDALDAADLDARVAAELQLVAEYVCGREL